MDSPPPDPPFCRCFSIPQNVIEKGSNSNLPKWDGKNGNGFIEQNICHYWRFSGIGQATAEMLLRQGAFVIGIGRSEEHCREAEKRIRRTSPDAQVHYIVADLSIQREVHQLADRVEQILGSQGQPFLDGLVNNAGTFTYWLTLTPEGIETQWAVNHLAPFLLTRQLLPLLQDAPLGRVVNISSDSHYSARLDWNDLQLRRHYNGLLAYGNTKLANILFTHRIQPPPGAAIPGPGFRGRPWPGTNRYWPEGYTIDRALGLENTQVGRHLSRRSGKRRGISAYRAVS